MGQKDIYFLLHKLMPFYLVKLEKNTLSKYLFTDSFSLLTNRWLSRLSLQKHFFFVLSNFRTSCVTYWITEKQHGDFGSYVVRYVNFVYLLVVLDFR